MADARLKKLRIQTGICSRNFKEKIYYENEIKEFTVKLKITDYKDEEEKYRAKMVPQQIDETKAALRDTETRLAKAVMLLQQHIDEEGIDHASKEWIAANDKLKEISC